MRHQQAFPKLSCYSITGCFLYLFCFGFFFFLLYIYSETQNDDSKENDVNKMGRGLESYLEVTPTLKLHQ